MYMYRVSKYNPIFRTNGKYINDEWTDYSDIGEYFSGNILTEKEYIFVENKYIQTILEILNKAMIISLRITNFENYEKNSWANKKVVGLNEISFLCMDCLRNKCWCKLQSDDFYIHFGYDYYIYIGCNLIPSTIKQIVNNNKLFCEEMESPYYE